MNATSGYFDYQQWRTSSAVTPEMLDSCLDRIAELEAENTRLFQRLNEYAAESSEDRFTYRRRAEQAEADRNACAEAYENETNLRLRAEAELAALKSRIMEWPKYDVDYIHPAERGTE